ncbi:MAG: TM1812 family CRISPR-associated protein [Acidobacteriota bacterium]|jgi:CRISPR-associated protein Csx16|nr:TM1812 family CRISPR-associated protein [Acidobacteriota bacterium]
MSEKTAATRPASGSGTARPLRLVSFVGLGGRRPDGSRGYLSTRYLWEGQRVETEFLAEALCSFFKPREVVLLATLEAQAEHGAALTARLAAAGVNPDFVELPAGASGDELWRQFELLAGALDLARRDTVLDITHGFRSQPFFSAAAVAFERAVTGREGQLRVVYGAFEARAEAENVTPVWDLTPFLELLDWSHALLLFLRTGQAEGVTAAVDDIGNRLLRAWAESGRRGPRPGEITSLSRALGRFGADLVALRSLGIVGTPGREGSAAELLRVLRAHRAQIEARLPPLARVLDRLEREIAPLAAGGALGVGDGEEALAALARRYLEMGRLLEAAIVVREAWLTRCTSGETGTPRTFQRDARLAAERQFRRRHAAEHERVSQLRNDLAHGGFRDNPARPERLVHGVTKAVAALRDGAPAPLAPATPLTAPDEAIFLNLSNHPSTGAANTWSEEQRQAALALAPRLVDLPFPAVPPDAGLDEIERLAGETLGRVPEGTVAAMVSGELALTMLLVPELQARGIRCLVATTRREVIELGDGRRESSFRFVRFRDCPALARAGDI